MKFAILSSAVLAASANTDKGMAGDCAVVAVRTDTVDDRTHFSIVTMRDYNKGDVLYATDAGVGKDRWWSYVATDVAATPSYVTMFKKNGQLHKCVEFDYWNSKCFARDNKKGKWRHVKDENGWWKGYKKGTIHKPREINVLEDAKVKEAQVFLSSEEEFYGNKGGKRVVSDQEWSAFEGFGRYEFPHYTRAGEIVTSEDFEASMDAHKPPITSWNHPEPSHDAWVANLELSNKGDNLFIFTADNSKMPVISKQGEEQRTGQHAKCGYETVCKWKWVRGRKKRVCTPKKVNGKIVYKQCTYTIMQKYNVVHPTSKQSLKDYEFICGATTSKYGFDDTRWINGEDMKNIHTHTLVEWNAQYWRGWFIGWKEERIKQLHDLLGSRIDPGDEESLLGGHFHTKAGADWTDKELDDIIKFFHAKQTEDLQLHSSKLPVPLREGETAVDLRESNDGAGHRDNWKYTGAQLTGSRKELLKRINKAPYNGGLWTSTNDEDAAMSYIKDIKQLFSRENHNFRILNPVDCVESQTQWEKCEPSNNVCGPGFKKRVILVWQQDGGSQCIQKPEECMSDPCVTPEPTESPTESPTDAPTAFCDPSNCGNWECEDWCKCYDEELVAEYESNNCHDDDDANSCICFDNEDVSDNHHRLKKMKKGMYA